jgi:hypothetical protein
VKVRIIFDLLTQYNFVLLPAGVIVVLYVKYRTASIYCFIGIYVTSIVEINMTLNETI